MKIVGETLLLKVSERHVYEHAFKIFVKPQLLHFPSTCSIILFPSYRAAHHYLFPHYPYNNTYPFVLINQDAGVKMPVYM